jgi:hypothetical protein
MGNVGVRDAQMTESGNCTLSCAAYKALRNFRTTRADFNALFLEIIRPRVQHKK